jgi:hypothetical protein
LFEIGPEFWIFLECRQQVELEREIKKFCRRFHVLLSLANGNTGKQQSNVKHRDIDYAVEEDRPGIWRWMIYPKIEAGRKVVSEPKYRTREAAVAACNQRDQ